MTLTQTDEGQQGPFIISFPVFVTNEAFFLYYIQDSCVTLTFLQRWCHSLQWFCFLVTTKSVCSPCHCTDTLIDETKDQPLQPNASLDKRGINHDRRKPCITVEWERTMSKSDVKFVLIKVQFKEVNDDSDLWRIKNSLISEGICQNPWGSDILHLLFAGMALTCVTT